MAYNTKWQADFPESVGNNVRPTDPIDNSLALETNGFPQFISNDPVSYTLQNDFLSQLLSNDQRLQELIAGVVANYVKKAGDTMTGQLVASAGVKGNLTGNADTATKLAATKKINNVAFDGSSDITIADSTKVAKSGDTMTGNLTAPIFIGNLSGNASSATNANNATNATNAANLYQDENPQAGTYRFLLGNGNDAYGGVSNYDALFFNSAQGVIYSPGYGFSSFGNTGMFVGDGDVANPVDTQKADLKISSWYSTGFYDGCSGKGYTAGIDHRTGNIFSKGSIVASGEVYAQNGWFRSDADTGWLNEKHGGGWYMCDDTWIRAYNGKAIYTPNVMKADGGFQGNLHGTADGANTVAGLSVASGRNNVGNQIVRTDGNGYIQAGYINSSNGDEGNNSNPARVWGTNGNDSYLRSYLTSALNVNYANTAGTAANANKLIGMNWNWSGQGGQPTWLWGGSDGANMYVYNPSNFSVNYANTAGNSNTVNGYSADALKNRIAGRNQPTMTALVNWSAMANACGASTCKNLVNAGTGISAYGGDQSGTGFNHGDIILNQSYQNFDALLVLYTDDSGDINNTAKFEKWELDFELSIGYRFNLTKNPSQYWYVYPKAVNGTASHNCSTTTRFYCNDQNCGIIEIYGLTY